MLPVRIREELTQLGLDVRGEPLAIQAGLSDAVVYRVGDYALKQHSLASLPGLARIHAVQQSWARSLSEWIPRLISWPSSLAHPPSTLLIEQDTCWECMDWKPGRVLASIDQVSDEHLQCVGRTLGVLHRTARNWNIGSAPMDAHKGIDHRMADRNQRLQQLVQTGFRSQHRAMAKWASSGRGACRDAGLVSLIDRALRSAERIAVQSSDAMERLVRTRPYCLWTHGDAWRGNWLFEGTKLSGLIDFTQAGFRWPGFDFARAIGSMVWGESSGWQVAWSSYCEALGEPGYTLGDVLLMHRVSTVLTLVAYLERLDSGEELGGRMLDRLQEVGRQLTTLG